MSRFACVSDRDIKDLIDDKDSVNTKRQIDTQYNVFLAWCSPETISKLELNEILGRFLR